MNPFRTLLHGALALLLSLPTLSFGQNDLCSGAIPITCGQFVNASNGGTATADPEVCSGNNSAPGVWYTFTGANSNDPGAAPGSTGDYIYVNTCASLYDVKVDVFEGSCGALTCVAGFDDTTPSACASTMARFVLPTTVGTVYYLLVSGKNASDIGVFTLSLQCAPAATGPVVLMPQTGVNYVPCGTSVTLQDAGGTGNYPNNCLGYTILEAKNNSTISITGTVTFTQQEPDDNLRFYSGSGFENLVAGYASDQTVAVNITGQPGEPIIVVFYSDQFNQGPGFDLNVSWSGPCEPATNEDCANATPISCGQTLSGYTNGASVEPDACIGNNTAPGVWYTFTGANSDDPGASIGSAGDLVYLSTCGGTLYDTKIDVFEGSCGTLTCVDGNDDPSSNFCFYGSRVVFPTTVGTTYYVLVSGKGATDFGDFDLTMTCGTGATGPVVLMPQTGMNYVTCGSNVTLQDAGGTGNYLDNSSGYTVFEASEFSAISLSGNVVFDDEQMDVLSIYAGSGFGTLLLTTANSGNINVSAPVGEPVIVYFQSDNFSNAAGLNLNVTYSGPCAPDTNQTCVQATPIACGQTISGTTHWATNDAIACVGNNTAPGVWFTFTGANSNDPGASPGSAGDHIFLSTCGAADYDSKIDVFEGSCGALSCVAGNDDPNPFLGCSFGSRLYFPTTVGTTYYILVSGKDASASGNFDLTMDCAAAQGGPVVLVPQTGANYLHCGTNVTLRDAGDLGNYPDNASGYTILEATGSSAITLSGTVVFDDEQVDQLAIYTGTGLETLEANYYNSGAVNFTGQPGESVIVFFYSDNFSNAAGFNLDVTWSGVCAQPANDYCFGAVPLLCGQVVNGSTGGVAPDASSCAGTTPSPGLWYTITGQNTNDPQAAAGSVGDVIELRTCGDAGFDTRIDVFEGSCGALTCVTSSDDGYTTTCGANKSRANFQSVVGTTYYILVSGTDASAFGTFDLTVDCGSVAELPVARVPPDAINYVPCGTNVTLRDWGSLGNYPNNANGYTVLQAGHTATVTLNGSYTLDGDDRLAVFRGAGTNDLVGEYFGSGTLNFTGLPGESITVFFYSDATNTAQGFDLNVSYAGHCVAPVNELCTDAIPITCGATVNGTTVGASGDGAPTCFGGSNMPGVWYSFTGENSNDPLAATGTPGDLVTLSSCPGDINDQLRLEVFEGDCNTMSCIVGSEANGFSPGCSFGSDLSINTMVGATYYVLVSFASPTDFGAFDLTMNCEALCTPMATNGLCTGAEPIPVTPYGTQSWTVANNSCVPLGTFYSTDCTDPTMPNSWSTWYSFTTGSVGNVHLGVEPITTYGFIFAEVYTACGATTNLCAEGDPAISYTFNLQPFSDYWMRIGTYTATSRGYYEISLAEANLPPPPGDYCNTAIPITIGTPVSGNNSWATNGPDEQGGCDFFQLAGDKGAWYTLAGVDGMMTASICNEDDKIIRVLSGSCGNLTCVESQTEVCGNGGFRVTWPASADSTYYLVVGVCCGAPAGPYTLLVEQDIRIGIQPRAFLQGPYDQATGLMRDDLRVNFLIPTETILHAPITYNTGPDAMVDWVTVELRDAADGQTVVDSWDVLVQADGSMINGWGVTFQSFNALPGSYYVAVHHRNHLSIISAAPIPLGGPLDVIDFSDGSTPTYGTDAQVDINGVKAMWCGDVNGDGVIKYTGLDNDRDEILQEIGGVVPTNTTSGRRDEDVNLDGVVKYTGEKNDRDAILQNIGGVIPTNVRVEQMP